MTNYIVVLVGLLRTHYSGPCPIKNNGQYWYHVLVWFWINLCIPKNLFNPFACAIYLQWEKRNGNVQKANLLILHFMNTEYTMIKSGIESFLSACPCMSVFLSNYTRCQGNIRIQKPRYGSWVILYPTHCVTTGATLCHIVRHCN